jgi:hypothetical protein
MSTKMIMALLLIILGVIVLAYSGISFKTPGEPVEFLGLRVATTNSHFIPPVAGAMALGGGVVLLLFRSKRA